MGMAASQARLLSITTRLSDNELRSQLINNQKIRLATESAKASERYVAALNNTKMMYSAYDVKGNPLNKELTFANLTAYSSYNNQYGLRNLSGQILVSEETAHNYENAVKAAENNTETTALEEFLKSYNLEKGTTFFDGVTTDIIDACLGMPEGESSGLTGADLKAMFLGETDTKGVEHEGYDAILSGTEYNSKFEPLFTEYSDCYEKYVEAMTKYIKTDSFQNAYDLSNLKTKIDSVSSLQNAKDIVDYWEDMLTTGKLGQLKVNGDTYFGSFIDETRTAVNNLDIATSEVSGNTMTVDGAFTITSTGAVTPLDPGDGTSVVIDGVSGFNTMDNTSTATVNLHYNDSDGNYVTGSEETYVIPNPSTWASGGVVHSPTKFDKGTAKSVLNSFYNSFIDALASHIDIQKVTFDTSTTEGQNAQAAKDRFIVAAQALSIYMFGQDRPNDYMQLNDLAFIFEEQDAGNLTDGQNSTNNFASVLDVLILDAVFNQLGDPIVTWIDTTNPNEDATAKAEWYTNLFNRMQTVTTTEKDDGTITEEIKTNYQVLEDGLATSAEWLQFALESGLVSMEQVDANNNWCSTLYSNCSDITETTDANEATVAEAEYNATMAKIEAKDKQFDIQLKNIDTEHESLQTEYDSIKSVLDKNIERNFKMYSA